MVMENNSLTSVSSITDLKMEVMVTGTDLEKMTHLRVKERRDGIK